MFTRRSMRFLWLALSGLLTGLTLVLPALGFLEWLTLIPTALFLLELGSDSTVRLRRLYGFGFLIIVAVIYGAIFLMKKTNIEYEYILTNSILDIDAIYSKSSRKRMESIDFKNIEAFGKANEASNSPAKVCDYTGNMNAENVYYIELFKNGEKKIIATTDDGSWKYKYSPIVLNNLYAGEVYDARLETSDSADYIGSEEGWGDVVADPIPKGELKSCLMPAVREVRRLKAMSVRQ